MLIIKGRKISANVIRVTVATPLTKIIDASSTPRIDPKRKLLSGTADPAAERIKIPMAKAIRYSEARLASLRKIVLRAKYAVRTATPKPAIRTPNNRDITDKPAVTKPMTTPGVMACAIASPASDRRRKTKNAPTGATEADRIVVTTNARRMNA